jgi:hypothetical protein
VLVFTSLDWGFTDASLPKLRLIVTKLESDGAILQVWHSSLSARFVGADAHAAFARAKGLLDEALHDPDFSGFRLGVSEGESDHELDSMRIVGDAFANARKG